MRKDVIVISFGIILIATVFCGCQSSQVKNEYKAIFESDVVHLVNYSIEKRMNKTDIVEVIISGRIENKMDRMINVNISAHLYDKNGDLIGIGFYRINFLRAKPNPGYSTTFDITYNGRGTNNIAISGKSVNEIDHITLRAEEVM